MAGRSGNRIKSACRSRLADRVTRAFLLLVYCVLFAGCATSQPPVLHRMSGPKLSGPLRTQSVAPCPTGWREVALGTSTDVWCETTTWKNNRGPEPSGPLREQSAAPCPKGWREVAPATSTEVWCETTIWKKGETPR